ncbi:CPBP family intramembrane glutamic endopeptidase [Flavilitoribacter nigricans]|uniref:CAAX prenyl protease 2/Lysostaphin resistance protein A-like domain-containing protein n=1 Tax=Flavilitoribacter nigricans (strain ATCC 23147 / DSM 23189 / NBRC 102662 / NCIMB 1420 / SS-2) TaxID=1122177 RepID=A0A2D0N1E5_FLAN2|nr:CPBP family intramembrane glutamic endopeptidase [Flavilitoribacter nigricans]PHN02250.1 hypothetical protein CRP01_32640 [Flavilitoribacter nigricans DSM 23189 = NBRC 102662]
MFNQIFTAGWEINLLLFVAVFKLAKYSVYRIIYPAIVGVPDYYSYEAFRHWYRRASIWSSVVFAPLFEEFLFTYLAYATFLRYAREGQEWVVMIAVAAGFALLHFRGDWNGMKGRLDWYGSLLLGKFQLDRFFYSLAAFLIYERTDALWITITIHYFFNYVLTSCIFERQDHPETSDRKDGRLLLLGFLELTFAIYATVYFYAHFPQVWGYLLVGTLALLAHFLWITYRLIGRHQE